MGALITLPTPAVLLLLSMAAETPEATDWYAAQVDYDAWSHTTKLLDDFGLASIAAEDRITINVFGRQEAELLEPCLPNRWKFSAPE